MPELPEVETARRTAQQVVGARVERVSVDDGLLVRNTTPQGLGRALSGATLTAAERVGKWVRITTDATSDVLWHFGMTGSLQLLDSDDEPGDFDHVRLAFDDERVLALRMPRKLGGVWIVRSDDERAEITGALGVDALDADSRPPDMVRYWVQGSVGFDAVDEGEVGAGVGGVGGGQFGA